MSLSPVASARSLAGNVCLFCAEVRRADGQTNPHAVSDIKNISRPIGLKLEITALMEAPIIPLSLATGPPNCLDLTSSESVQWVRFQIGPLVLFF